MAKGKGGKGKGKGKGLDKIKGIDDVIAASVKGGAQVAYGPAIRDQRKQVKQVRAQKAVINNAYKAYDARLSALQSADAARTDQVRQSQTDAAGALEGVGQQVTDRGAAEAARRAVLFGQSGSVEEGIRALGGGASVSRVTQAGVTDSAMANLGLAQYSDLSRRAATGSRDRIRAQEERRNVLREEQGDLQALKKERGGFMADKAWERIQEEEQNKIARAGLRLDRKQGNKDRRSEEKMHEQDLAVDVWSQLQEGGGGGKGGKGGGGKGDGNLSPSEKEEYRRSTKQIKSVIGAYEKAIKNGKEPNKAAKIARKRTGSERWMATIAKQMISGGGLTKQGRQLLLGKLPPGSKIPNFLR